MVSERLVQAPDWLRAHKPGESDTELAGRRNGCDAETCRPAGKVPLLAWLHR